MTIAVEVTVYVDDSVHPEVQHWKLLKFGDGFYERSLFLRYSYHERYPDAPQA